MMDDYRTLPAAASSAACHGASKKKAPLVGGALENSISSDASLIFWRFAGCLLGPSPLRRTHARKRVNEL
jgi:hypothetical protein